MIIQIKRGTTAQAADWTGLEGTLFIDLSLKQLHLHDGVTKGGSLVGGVSEARVQELIDAKVDALAVADIDGLALALEGKASLVDGKVPADQLPETAVADVTGLETALAAKASLVEGKVPAEELPEVELTTTQIQQLATEFGFTKGEDGKWVLDQGTVTP